MTTIVGIEAKNSNKGIILASDLSATKTDWTPRGDVAYRRQTKSDTQKIHVNRNGDVALSTAGVIDKKYFDFLEAVLRGDIDIKKVIERESFPEFSELNLNRWDGKFPDDENINSLILATRFGEPKLYTCWPLGKVEERNVTSIGSGSSYALQFLSKQSENIYRGLPIPRCIELAVSSLDEAAQDIYTGGLDLVVVTNDGIREFGADIKNAIDSSKRRVIQKIKKSFS